MSGLNEISPLLPHYRFVILIIILGEKLEIPGGEKETFRNLSNVECNLLIISDNFYIGMKKEKRRKGKEK